MSASKSHVSVVFAGGQSRRMGQNKLLLPRTPGMPETVLTHVISVASEISHAVIVLTHPLPDRMFHTVVDAFPNVRWIRDEIAYDGPLQAIGRAFAESDVSSDSIWSLMAGDLPGLDKRVLSTCYERLQPSVNVDAALVVREQRWQPLLGCYRGHAVRKMIRQANQGERRLMSVLQSLTITGLREEISSWPSWWTRPIHTMEDYDAWCDWIRHQDDMEASM